MKKFREATRRNTVEIDEDIFIDMIWERIKNTELGHKYSDEFWEEIISWYEGSDWFGPDKNNPGYFVDNIAVNGRIYTFENFLVEHEDWDPDEVEYMSEDELLEAVKEICDEEGYYIVDEWVVVDLGLR